MYTSSHLSEKQVNSVPCSQTMIMTSANTIISITKEKQSKLIVITAAVSSLSLIRTAATEQQLNLLFNTRIYYKQEQSIRADELNQSGALVWEAAPRKTINDRRML